MDTKYIVTWILVIAGWALLIWNSNRISRRAEIRSICDRLMHHLFDFKSEFTKCLDQEEFSPKTCTKGLDPRDLEEKVKDYSFNLESRIILHCTLAELLNSHLGKLTELKPISDELFAKLRDDCLSEYESMLKNTKPQMVVEGRVKVENLINDYIASAVEDVEEIYIKHYAKTGFFKSIRNEIWIAFSTFPTLIGAAIASFILFCMYQIGFFSVLIESCLRAI